MSSTMQSPYAALLAMMQNGSGATGFMNPGGGPNNGGVPKLTNFTGGGAAGAVGGGMAAPAAPAPSAASAPAGGGMFAGLLNNPMMMGLLAKQFGGGGAPAQAGVPNASGVSPGLLGGQTQSPMNNGQPLPSQTGAYNIPQQGGIQALLARLYGGQGGQ